MKNLFIIFILFTLLASTCEEEAPGYQIEPSINIHFKYEPGDFITYSESINKKKHRVKDDDFPGIDMHASSTKFWIEKGIRHDSFTVNYRLKTFYQANENWINFDTLYVSETSFEDAKMDDGGSYHNIPRIYFINR